MINFRIAAVATFGLAIFSSGQAGAQSPPSAQPSAASNQTTQSNQSSPASATGTVVGPDSQPQAGIPIQVNGPEGQTTVFTDEKGKWSLYNLSPGTYQAKPLARSGGASQATINFTISKSGLFGSSATYNASVMKLDKNWSSEPQ